MSHSMKFTGDTNLTSSWRAPWRRIRAPASAPLRARRLTARILMSNSRPVLRLERPGCAGYRPPREGGTSSHRTRAPGQNDKIFAWINGAHGEGVVSHYAPGRDGIECSRHVGC